MQPNEVSVQPSAFGKSIEVTSTAFHCKRVSNQVLLMGDSCPLIKGDPMNHQRSEGWSRREFLRGLALAGTAGLVGLHSRLLAAEPPPETTRLRLHKMVGICVAPQYVAEELMYLEGFTEVQYV